MLDVRPLDSPVGAMFDRALSLEALENDSWGAPSFPSGLVTAAHDLRRKPVGQLSPGELRLLIGQEIGLTYLVPLALEMLEADLLVEGDYYPGDLLKSVLSLDPVFWNSHQALWARADDVASAIESLRDGPENDVLHAVASIRQLR